ncbi:MAG TPA: hypothetical protein VFI73_11195 [Candidatus Nitrosopolaris sp.]|nr:hypothetical protein [Candidatus Nitrosopolaris sp.]
MSNNNRGAGPNRTLIMILVGVVTFSSIILVSQTQDQLVAKKGSQNSSVMPGYSLVGEGRAEIFISW